MANSDNYNGLQFNTSASFKEFQDWQKILQKGSIFWERGYQQK
jgi:hypothetical protein